MMRRSQASIHVLLLRCFYTGWTGCGTSTRYRASRVVISSAWAFHFSLYDSVWALTEQPFPALVFPR
jgi:hypothetical protein